MSVQLYFGLPGAGKTTLLTYLAIKAIKSKRYAAVYGNVPLKVFGYTYINDDSIGVVGYENALILIDEATLFADSRDFKSFPKERMTYFLQHRHFNVDIVLFAQQWDSLDRRIRVITDRVYYVYKGPILGKWFTRFYRVPYGIIIPDPKKGQEKLGEIIQGYSKPNLLVQIFSPYLYRPKYYHYFDSWHRPPGFKPVPKHFRPYVEAWEDQLITTEKQMQQLRHKEDLKKLRSAFVDDMRSMVCFSWLRKKPKSIDQDQEVADTTNAAAAP